ncbi:hypothetical protein [Actinospica robiniae]|uniref:hypothetical protein n=1 Tax=Actinospica robiniae TaxID=304901 RepID=UPI00041B6300|nr:hypothetical protein [Actinospica robiniae]
MRVSFASAPGSPHKPSEDTVAATPHLAFVLDGLSSPPELGTGCIHSTPWYVAHLAAALIEQAATRPATPLADCAASALAKVADSHAATCDLTHTGTPSSSIALLRENEATIEYLSLFDSVILLDGPDGIAKISDLRVDGYAQAEHQQTLRYEIGTPEHQQAVSRLVAAQRPHRNTPDGYWVAGSNPEAAHHALTGTIERAHLKRAAILSDGASCLAEDYHQTDWTGLLDLLHTHGPEHLIHQVRQAEATDPTGTKWPRYKAGDDATALLCLTD